MNSVWVVQQIDCAWNPVNKVFKHFIDAQEYKRYLSQLYLNDNTNRVMFNIEEHELLEFFTPEPDEVIKV